jgi:hypothetical protein
MYPDNIKITDFELRGYIYIRNETKQGGECKPSHTPHGYTHIYMFGC